MDEVGKRALKRIKRVHPVPFVEKLMQRSWSKRYGEEIEWGRSPRRIKRFRIDSERAVRPNGLDQPTWND